MRLILPLLALSIAALPGAAQHVTLDKPFHDTIGRSRLVFSITRRAWKYGQVTQLCEVSAYSYAVIGSPCTGAPVPFTSPARPKLVSPLFGATLSGAEARDDDAVRPTLNDMKNYVDRLGFRLIRYPFKMERMTPQRIAELKILVAYARSRGVPIILDNHNFAWPPITKQVADWTAFARHWPNDGTVLLELNNEPKGVTYTRFGLEAKQVIAGLRANGVKHPILLGGPGYSAITRFDKAEPAAKDCESAACGLDRAPGVLDPLRRTYIVGHRYFDWNSSGTVPSCRMSHGRNRTSSGFDSFAAQLRKRGLQAYITETAFGSWKGIPSSCEAVAADAIADIRANADVLLGVTWWGGGRIWPENYPYKIDCKKAERFTCPVSQVVRRLAGQ